MAKTGRSGAHSEQLSRHLDQLEDAILTGDSAGSQRIMAAIWECREQAAATIADRLASGESKIPGLAFEMIMGFAGEKAEKHLRKVARSHAAEDVIRLAARRRIRWPEGREKQARMAFLAGLDDVPTAITGMVDRATRGFSFPPDGEVLQDALAYLEAMPEETACATIRMAGRELGREVVWVLRALLHHRRPGLRAAAMRQMALIGDTGAAGAIQRAVRATRDLPFSDEAGDTRRRLSVHPLDAAEEPSPQLLPPLHSAYLSYLDGDGGQVAIVVRERAGNSFDVAHVLLSDHRGVRDAIGASSIQWDRMESLYETDVRGRLVAFGDPTDDAKVGLVEVPVAACRGALKDTLEWNDSPSSRVPARFEIWEPLFHDEDPPADHEPVISPSLPDTDYLTRDDLFLQSGHLFDHTAFESWFFNPEEVDPILAEIPRPRQRRLTDAQFAPLAAALLDASSVELLRSRLRRQAWLLEAAGEHGMRDLALAASARLDGCPMADAHHHPFVRAMIRSSIENLFGTPFSVD